MTLLWLSKGCKTDLRFEMLMVILFRNLSLVSWYAYFDLQNGVGCCASGFFVV